ncbi:BTB/POZ domain-containing protein [Ditylenchus destructor]|uniref:BTB/POZ domain-containing protein n=1 Tax=Ditylenchus destructor TaxID=166010 RepID=A0AAD4MY37_9BILA|nr:BTB/POZ domain-containing protein [Ditylenchus destructor]
MSRGSALNASGRSQPWTDGHWLLSKSQYFPIYSRLSYKTTSMISGAMRNSNRRIAVAHRGLSPPGRKRVRLSSPIRLRYRSPSSESESDVIIDDHSDNSSEKSDSSSSTRSQQNYSPSSPVYRRGRCPSPRARGRSPHFRDGSRSPRYYGYEVGFYDRYHSPSHSPSARNLSPRAPSCSPARWSDSDVAGSSPKRAHGSKLRWYIQAQGELSDQFEHLYESNDLSDVTLIVEGKRFPVHKLVLAARSSYFRGMFYGGLRESVDNEVVLHEVSADNFEIILRYVYTGCVLLDGTNTSQLITLCRLAHMYDLESLQKNLVRKIEGIRVTLKNFNELFSCSVLLSLTYIKQKCKTYALSKLPTLCKSDEFCELSVTHLEELFHPRDWSKSKDKIIANGLIRYIEKNPNTEESVVALMKKVKLRLVKDGNGEWIVCRDIYRISSEKRHRIDDSDN